MLIGTELLVAIALGLVLGALGTWLWLRGQLLARQEKLGWLEQRSAAADALAREAEGLRSELARIEAEHRGDRERLAWMHDAEQRQRETFEALASQVLHRNSKDLLERSREQLDGVVKALGQEWRGERQSLERAVEPVDRSLRSLDAQVGEMEKERRGTFEALRQEIQLLRDAHRRLRGETQNLAEALRSPTIRGRWGEAQLRRVVEMAGMVEHVDFALQADAEGLRPDLLIKLPRRGQLPVDAKAPMKAFLEAAEAGDEVERRRCLDAHVKAMRDRIRELGHRRYWERLAWTPEFVVMFLPSESAMAAAFERDPELFDFAQRHRVLPATPLTLLALLKTVAYGWRQQDVAEGARKIADLGRELHGRLGSFADNLRRMGRGLEQAVEAYNRGVGSLERRVLPAVRRLEEAGATSEELPEIPEVSPPRKPS